jgi:hypothetical protein
MENECRIGIDMYTRQKMEKAQDATKKKPPQPKRPPIALAGSIVGCD